MLRKRRVEIAMRGCGIFLKDLREVNKIQQSRPDVPSFEKECFRSERRDSGSKQVYEQCKMR